MSEQAGFKDHFSGMAANYAKFRPRYPDPLFADLAALVPRHDLAWDCGCGNGQATIGLAKHFGSVIGTDPSAAQIDNADTAPNIAYHVAAAEDAPVVPSGSVDLILAAQAAHWFDLDRFYDEVRRVAAPGAAVVLASYMPTVIEGDSATDAALQDYYHNVVGPYWPPERVHVDNGYKLLSMPFPEETGPSHRIEEHWSLDRLIDYCGTWSAAKEYRRLKGTDPLPILREMLSGVWTDPDQPKRIVWPIALRIGRVGGA